MFSISFLSVKSKGSAISSLSILTYYFQKSYEIRVKKQEIKRKIPIAECKRDFWLYVSF